MTSSPHVLLSSLTRLRLAVLTLTLACLAPAVQAHYQCKDRWGHRYVVADLPFDDVHGVKCKAVPKPMVFGPASAASRRAVAPAGSVSMAFGFNDPAPARPAAAPMATPPAPAPAPAAAPPRPAQRPPFVVMARPTPAKRPAPPGDIAGFSDYRPRARAASGLAD
jgi:hypothetical protein